MNRNIDKIHEYFMSFALEEANQAYSENEVPVGAVIVHENKVIAQNHNRIEQHSNPLHHAEILVIEQALRTIGSKWLNECTLYVTLEPCSMCAGALVLSRISTIVFGAFDSKTGACGSLLDIPEHPLLNHNPTIIRGILAAECGQIVKNFFSGKR